MTTELIPYQAVEKMAIAISKSKMFGFNTPESALAIMLVAQSQGLHPVQAMADYHNIQNKPSLKTDAMLARFQQKGGSVEWITHTDQEVKARFSHPQGGTLELSWTMAMAKAAGLASKDNWKQYPRAMLRARVISEGVRAIYPAVLGGMYAPEEVADFDAKPPKVAPVVAESSTTIEGTATVATADDIEAAIIEAMDGCETFDCLKDVFLAAKQDLKGNKEALTRIAAMKDQVKKRIEAKEAEEVVEYSEEV
jgi:hypothetical protein